MLCNVQLRPAAVVAQLHTSCLWQGYSTASPPLVQATQSQLLLQAVLFLASERRPPKPSKHTHTLAPISCASSSPTCAGTSRALQRVVAVVGEVEGAAMHFAALDMRHPLLARRALVQKVYSHYMRAAWPSLVRLLGSSSLLGAPCLAMPPPGAHPSTQLAHRVGAYFGQGDTA